MCPASQNASFSGEGSDPPGLWRYHFTKISLVEEFGESRYVYGLWEGRYGCWKTDGTDNKCREFVPTWKMFDDNGIWLSQAETRRVKISNYENSMASRWLFEADAAFAALYSGIPRQIRSVVAPMGRHQGLALDLIWHESDLVFFFDAHVHGGTDRRVFEGLSLLAAEYWDREKRRKLAADILNAQRPEFVF